MHPTAATTASYLAWETRGTGLDPDVRDLYIRAGAHFPSSPVVNDRRPGRHRLRTLATPALVLPGAASRCHDAEALARAALRALPDATVQVLPGLTHHSIPTERPDEVSSRMLVFLSRPGC